MIRSSVSSGFLTRSLGVLVVILVMLGGWPSGPSALAEDRYVDRDAQQEVVERYAPIVKIRPLLEACSHHGEQFRPVPVEIVFGSPDVRLMQRGSPGHPDVVVKAAPVAQDLAGLDNTYYLDLPGNPRDPGCTYQDWSNARMEELGIEPSIYARFVTEEGREGIVLQYWFYWTFNLFNDTHESDWEGIQLTFDNATSVQEILDNDLHPSSVAFAQHGGGEYADWDDDKVETEDNRIVVHPSSGSHASYFNATTWLGWGENGSGFGCDITDEPDYELPVNVILIPDEVDPQGEFAWLTFEGRWGQRESGVFNGPLGPNTKNRWDAPITWSEGIRKNSLPVPAHATIGPSPSGMFCAGSQIGSRLMQYFPVDPAVTSGLVLAVLGVLVAIAFMAWRYVVRAISLYLHNLHVYLVLGVVTVPIAAIGARVENHVMRWIRDSFGATDTDVDRVTELVGTFLSNAASTIQEVLIIALLAPGVTYATYLLSQNKEAHTLASWRAGALHIPGVFAATTINAVIVIVLVQTLVLLPLAIYKGVSWFYVSQTIIIDGASTRDARLVSARTIRGHWRRAFAIVLWIAVVTRLPGPIIGTLALIAGGVSIDTAEWISGIVFCMILPIGIIASTLFYMNIHDDLAVPVPDSLIRRAYRRVRGQAQTSPLSA